MEDIVRDQWKQRCVARKTRKESRQEERERRLGKHADIGAVVAFWLCRYDIKYTFLLNKLNVLR